MTATSELNGEKIYYNEEAEEWRYMDTDNPIKQDVNTNKPIKQGLWARLKNKILRRK